MIKGNSRNLVNSKSKKQIKTEKTSSYGWFDKDNKEFVITRPDTPTPWINYLGSDEYCAMISNTGGGYSFHKDPRNRRLLRYRYNNIPADRPGRYLYLKDESSNDYWSLTWQPVLKNLKDYGYECRHGLGYTKIKSNYSNILSEISYFVPLNENLEVWSVSLKNQSKTKRRFKLFSYVEFCLFEAVMDMTDFQYTLNIAKAVCQNNTIYHLTGYFPYAGRNGFVYFAVNNPLNSFDCDRETFIGPYRNESNPLAVEKGSGFKSQAHGGNPIGSHCLSVELDKNEEKQLVFILGYSENMKEADTFIKKYKYPEAALKELGKLKDYWQKYLDKFSFETPDKETDLMANTWNQYQCRTTFSWSRSASFYESGIGRGMGFRDSNQDVLGVLHALPERVKLRIKELLANEFENGSCHHQFFPLTKKGEKGGYSDDPLWLILSVTHYIKETGDFAFLDEEVAFVEGSKGSVYEHLLRAVGYVFSQKGPHGLPLIGFADWNDCLNLMGPKKAAESVWVGQFLHWAARAMIDLARASGKTKDISKFEEIVSWTKEKVNKYAWDGDWYIRAFTDDGVPVGSKSCKEGKIDLIAQAWAVIGGIGEKEQLISCMDMAKKYLDCEHGLMLIAPPYTTFDPKIGAMGTFAPGLKENGGIFCHANPWAMIAETILGRGDLAFEYYKKIAPVTRNKIADIHKTEGYVYAQFIAGTSHSEPGRARNSWLTGSATWNFTAISNYILGIRADYKGLIVDPCIPRGWNDFKAKRYFRGAWYNIEVTNPKHISKGVKSVNVDGKAINSNVVPVFNDQKEHKVKVIMGEK